MDNLIEYICQDGVIDTFFFVKLFVVISVLELFGSIVSSVFKSFK